MMGKCSRGLVLAVLCFASFTALADCHCQDWHHVKGTHYYFKNTVLPYFQAVAECELLGARLFTMKTSSVAVDTDVWGWIRDNMERAPALVTKVWLGLNASEERTTAGEGWTWSDGTPLGDFNQWHEGGGGYHPMLSRHCAFVEIRDYLHEYADSWHSSGCIYSNTRYHTVCERLYAPCPPILPTQCEVGAADLKNWKTFDGRYYVLRTSPSKGFTDATKECQGLGAYLATSNSPPVNEFLMGLLAETGNNQAWIGLSPSKDTTSGEYHWQWMNSEEEFDANIFHNWTSVPQIVDSTSDRHALIHKVNKSGVISYEWQIKSDGNTMGYFCERIDPPCHAVARCTPDSANYYKWHEYKGHFYYFISDLLDFDEGVEKCKQFGASPATINSKGVNDLLIKLFPNSPYTKAFIGLVAPVNVREKPLLERRQGHVWKNGARFNPSAYHNWSSTEPKEIYGPTCTTLEKIQDNGQITFQWVGKSCHHIAHIFCERSAPPCQPMAPCTRDYEEDLVWREHGKNYYSLVSEAHSHVYSRTHCPKYGASLAAANTPDANAFLAGWLAELNYDQAWIGLWLYGEKAYMEDPNNNATERRIKWRWEDWHVKYDSSVFHNWTGEEPSPTDICARLVRSSVDGTYNWEGNSCYDGSYSFFCGRGYPSCPQSPPTTPGPCIPGPYDYMDWREFNGRYYVISEKRVAYYHSAKSKCEEWGGVLATCNDKEVHEFLAGLLKEGMQKDPGKDYTRIWIGLYYTKETNKEISPIRRQDWAWESGEVYDLNTYNNWTAWGPNYNSLYAQLKRVSSGDFQWYGTSEKGWNEFLSYFFCERTDRPCRALYDPNLAHKSSATTPSVPISSLSTLAMLLVYSNRHGILI